MALKGLYLNKNVVQQKHDSSSPPSNLRIPKDVLTNVANIPNLRMTQTKSPRQEILAKLEEHQISYGFEVSDLPDCDGRIPHDESDSDGQDQAGHET